MKIKGNSNRVIMFVDEGRTVLVNDALTDKKEWINLFNSLTFMEGYALSLAITEWSNKFLEQEK
jgi:hypothetical protein